jgi:hypothetical protein
MCYSMRSIVRAVVMSCSTLVAPGLSATPWSTIVVPEANERTDFQPVYYAEVGSDGVWAVGRKDNAVLAVKFDSLGNAIAHAHAPVVMDDDFFGLRYVDGGLLLAGRTSALEIDAFSPCIVQRFTADGRLLWSEHVGSRNRNDAETCGAIGVDAGGGIWIHLHRAVPGRLKRLTADGNTQVTVDLAQYFGFKVREMVVDPASPGLWLGGSTTASGDQSVRARIIRLDERGQLQWSWDSQRNAAESEVVAMSTSAAYGIHALLRELPRAPISGYGRTLRALRLGNNGSQLHDKDLRFDRDVAVQGISALDTVGSWVALKQSQGAESVAMMRLTLSGVAGPMHDLGGTYSCANEIERVLRCAVFLRQDGGAWLVSYASDQSPGYPQLIGIDSTGAERFRQSIAYGSRSTLRADDAVLASAVVIYPPGEAGQPVPHTAQFGAVMQTWAEVRGLMPSYFDNPIAGFTRNGDPIIAGNYGNDTKDSLLEFFPSTDSGEAAWRFSYPGKWHGRVLVSERLACLSGEYRPDRDNGNLMARCHRRDDGAPLWRWTREFFGEAYNFLPLDDGRSVSIFNSDQHVRHSVLDLDGVPQPPIRAFSLLSSPYVVFNDAGDALLSHRNDAVAQSAVVLLGADGLQRYSIALTNAAYYNHAYLLNDGSALLSHGNGVERHGPDGALMWTHTFDDTAYQMQTLAVGERVLMIRKISAMLNAPVWDEVDALDLHTGVLLWSERFLTPGGYELPAVASIGTHALGMARTEGTRLRWRVLDSASGQVLREQTVSCGAGTCLVPQLNVRADERARLVVPVWSSTAGPATRVLGLDRAGDTPPRVRADQDGISGAWYSPANTGQGLMIQWLGTANTLFAPWFTFSNAGGNALSELRWYTLQGSVAAGAHTAELGIYRNSGGDFGSGATSAQRVGTASLEFESCERALLRYQFDASFNAAAQGSVSLERLTPGAPCLGAGASFAASSGDALDAEMDGAWYDPAAGGQGLMFSRYPATGGNGGTLFAPWFTFDPATAPDDASEQHWFTLQGVYDGSGQAALTIFRTTGGSFDGTPTVNTHAVGTATLVREACDSARLGYRFYDSDVASSFRSMTGNIHLRKAGGCN